MKLDRLGLRGQVTLLSMDNPRRNNWIEIQQELVPSVTFLSLVWSSLIVIQRWIVPDVINPLYHRCNFIELTSIEIK